MKKVILISFRYWQAVWFMIMKSKFFDNFIIFCMNSSIAFTFIIPTAPPMNFIL
ncbi:hypothetical protein X975_16610, partial [Stegodyphus mimosarum]